MSMHKLEALVPGLKIETLGGAAPVQGWGTYNGERFYFRYRYNNAQLHVGPPRDDDPSGLPEDRLYNEEYDVNGDPSDEYAGSLGDFDYLTVIPRMFQNLKPIEECGKTHWERVKDAIDAAVKQSREEESS